MLPSLCGNTLTVGGKLVQFEQYQTKLQIHLSFEPTIPLSGNYTMAVFALMKSDICNVISHSKGLETTKYS